MRSVALPSAQLFAAALGIALFCCAVPTSILAQARATETSPREANAFVVTLTGPEVVRGVWETTDRLRLVCRFPLQATATGGAPGATATWVHGRGSFYRFDGFQTSQQTLSAETLANYFAGPQLTTGRAVSSTRLAASDAPFRVDYLVTYRIPGGVLRQTTYTVRCLPPEDEATSSRAG